VGFGYTRLDAILLSVGLPLLGWASDAALEAGGMAPQTAGNVVLLTLVGGVTLVWTATYVARVRARSLASAAETRCCHCTRLARCAVRSLAEERALRADRPVSRLLAAFRGAEPLSPAQGCLQGHDLREAAGRVRGGRDGQAVRAGEAPLACSGNSQRARRLEELPEGELEQMLAEVEREKQRRDEKEAR